MATTQPEKQANKTTATTEREVDVLFSRLGGGLGGLGGQAERGALVGSGGTGPDGALEVPVPEGLLQVQLVPLLLYDRKYREVSIT